MGLGTADPDCKGFTFLAAAADFGKPMCYKKRGDSLTVDAAQLGTNNTDDPPWTFYPNNRAAGCEPSICSEVLGESACACSY